MMVIMQGQRRRRHGMVIGVARRETGGGRTLVGGRGIEVVGIVSWGETKAVIEWGQRNV